MGAFQLLRNASSLNPALPNTFFSMMPRQDLFTEVMLLSYGLPLLGGIIADRYLGMKKAVTFGAFVLVLGHIDGG